MNEPAPASSFFARYGAFGIVLVFAIALSVFARVRAPGPELGLMPTQLALWLLPSVSILVYLGVRLSGGSTDRHGDLLLSWVAVAPSMLHVVHLSFGLGVLAALDRGLALVATLLNLGFAVLVPKLGFRSPYGIRLAATLGSEPRWRRAHRWLSLGFVAAAAAALATFWLPPRADLAALLGGPFFALGMGFFGALRPPSEDPGPAPRPSPGANNPEDGQSSP